MLQKTIFLFAILWLTSCAQTKSVPVETKYVPKAKTKVIKVDKIQEKLCINGEGEICYKIGKSYVNGNDDKKAFHYFQIGCNIDHSESCYEAAILKYAYKSPIEAEQFITKACRLKSGNACLEGANLIEKKGHIVTSDDEQQQEMQQNIFSMLVQACDYQQPDGCLKLGMYYYNKNELERAFSFFKRSCNLGHLAGCYNAGLMKTKMGQEAYALEFYITACDKGNAESCYNLTCSYAKRGQEEKAFLFLERALSFGYSDWHLLEHDLDLENIRKSGKFSNLIQTYKNKK